MKFPLSVGRSQLPTNCGKEEGREGPMHCVYWWWGAREQRGWLWRETPGAALALHPSAGLADCSLVQWVQRGSGCAEQRLAWRSGSQNTGSASSWGSPMASHSSATGIKSVATPC